jgi:magnesium-transporting ATPase (P-type)
MEQTAWHALEAAEVLDSLDTVEAGLSGREAERRREKYGTNEIPLKEAPSFHRIVLRQFLSPLIYVLMAAGAISISIGDAKDAAFIFFVVLLNAALGTFQEYRAEKSAAALHGMLETRARVLRDGEEVSLEASELVPGDIARTGAGARVPADMRLLEVQNFQVDESALTGESEPSGKSVSATESDTPVGDRECMAFAGTTVTSGRATGVVVDTGSSTEFGRIAEAATSGEAGKPPLVQRMERFARLISLVVVGVGIALGVLASVRGFTITEAFFLAVALAVSAIPEGLPVGLTVALSRASTAMARRNVIVRQLAAVESLGSCTCIASDKTGTFTLNKQVVRKVWLPGGDVLEVAGEGYSGEGEVKSPDGGPPGDGQRELLERLSFAAAIDNEAHLTREGGGWVHHGDPIEVALLAMAHKAGVIPADVRREAETSGGIEFSSERKFSATLYREGGSLHVAVKGSPEVIVGFCDRFARAGGASEIDPAEAEEAALDLSADGYRVLAVATGEMEGEPDPESFDEEELPPLVFLGTVALVDPLRPGAVEAVEKCRSAGVRVVMITGDHPATALYIGRELGIADSDDQVLTGNDLEKLGDPDEPSCIEAVEKAAVFARVSPLQKVKIVEALMAGGDFVAVTGDGVNDAPALRRANLGVAMGSGTDVAKDTASIIITDDDFSSIVAGIEEGRFAYDNIRKVIWLLVSTGLAEVILFSLVVTLGLPLALVAIQILWLNLVTNGIQHIALVFERGDPALMSRPPRDPSEGVFDKRMVGQTLVSGLTIGLVAFAAWVYLVEWSGSSPTEARNLILLLMVFFENMHVLNCRSEHKPFFRIPLSWNYLLLGAIVVAQGIHVAALYVPFLQDLLQTGPVSFLQWAALLLVSTSVLVSVEFYKAVVRRRMLPAVGAGQP